MKKKKMSSQNKFFLFVLAGGLAGLAAGIFSYVFGLSLRVTWPRSLNMPLLIWVVRLFIWAFFALTIWLLFKSRQIQKEEQGEELDEELYRQMLKYLEYGTLTFNIFGTLFLFDLFTSQIVFGDFSYLTLLIFWMAQYYMTDTIERVRHYKLSVFSMPSDMLDFIRTYDEVEMMVNYEQAFKILFQLTQYILPALYVILFLLSWLTGQLQLVGFLIVVFIHIYISAAQLPMIRKYFR